MINERPERTIVGLKDCCHAGSVAGPGIPVRFGTRRNCQWPADRRAQAFQIFLPSGYAFHTKQTMCSARFEADVMLVFDVARCGTAVAPRRLDHDDHGYSQCYSLWARFAKSRNSSSRSSHSAPCGECQLAMQERAQLLGHCMSIRHPACPRATHSPARKLRHP
ncbi:hypothetical protein OG21DRAFT_1057065 [Imleria badia]|nr:hypothetical protein OG21DRAFT_1057065 [Imleria badia]